MTPFLFLFLLFTFPPPLPLIGIETFLNLLALDLSHNQLTHFPNSITKLQKLQILDLRGLIFSLSLSLKKDSSSFY